MHPRVMAERRMAAQQRMSEAVRVLSDRFGVPAPEPRAVRAVDQATRGLFDLEDTAVFLAALADATAPTASLPDASERMASLTVAEAVDLIADADGETLDALAAAETAGKDRKGVHAAIDARRMELATAEPEAGSKPEDGDAGTE